MALKKIKTNLDRVLDKNMQDLVRGIRNHKEDEARYISECLEEIKQELRSGDLSAKVNAVNKLLYLQMLGYEISWAAFNIIEVMSSVKFTHKRLGYLTASQSFHVGTDVLMLSTNMIRKDLCSSTVYDAGVALSGLSCFISPDLAMDLANDIMSLMMSTKPYLRKKAVLLMYKVYLNYPDALRPSFSRLKDRLEDEDPGVQSAAVNVICELARKNPRNYLSLAPTFFKLMTTSSNNWMLIKIIKLFGSLTPLEPRLGKKLIEPLTNLIHSTSAMSLLYECINTVIAVLVSISSDLPNHSTSVQLCVQKLRVLIEDSDQNLKYLGLLAFSKILKSHPKSVQAHKDLVLQCLDDRDESIRLRALDLLYGMVSKKNLMEIVKKLMVHMEKAEGTVYRDELMTKIIEICTQNNYQYVVNFEWYVSVLVELTKIKGTQHGRLLANQMMDVAIRVVAIRSFAVGQMAILIDNSHLFSHNSHKNGICEILYAAAWISGEYAEYLADPFETLNSMFKPKVTSLPGHIQSVYVQNIVKLYASILVKAELDGDESRVKDASQLLVEKLPMFAQSSDLEVQERACGALQLMKYVSKLLDKGVSVGEEVRFLFAGELNPVAPKAQRKVPVPEGLDLDKWINNPPSKSADLNKKKNIFSNKDDAQTFYGDSKKEKKSKAKDFTEEELKAQREARLQAQASNPHYLKLGAKAKPKVSEVEEDINVANIPVETIDLDVDIEMTKGLEGLANSDKYYIEALRAEKKKKKEKKSKEGRKNKKDRKKRRKAEESDEDIPPVHQVSSVYDMPEGAKLADSDLEEDDNDEIRKKLDVNLDEPLRDDERIPIPQHRTLGGDVLPEPVEKSEKKKKKKDRDSSKKGKSGKKSKKISETDNSISGLIQVDDVAAVEPAVPEEPIRSAVNGNGELARPKKEKIKEKKDKKEKKEKKSKSGKHKKDKSSYETAEGSATPPNVMDISSLNLSNYKTLASNSHLTLDFESRVSQKSPNTIMVAVVFSNGTTDNVIKSIDFMVLDSMNAKLNRSNPEEPVKVPFELPASYRNEAQFVFNVKNLTQPQKLKGTVTYILKDGESTSHEKLDFKLVIPCKDFLVASRCAIDDFTKLLRNGEITAKYSKRTPTGGNLQETLTKICFYAHMFIVEQVENSASLYSCSIQGHHVCLLVKFMGDGEVSIDGKSTDSSFLSYVVDDIIGLIKS